MAKITKTFPYTFIRGKLTKTAQATIPIQAKAIQYGLGIFTGIRGHWNAKQKNLYLFRMEDHFKRLQEAAKIVGMNFPWNYSKFEKTIINLIKKNKAKEDLYLRPTLYSGSIQLTPRFDNEGDDLAIYMISLKDYYDSKKGLEACVSSWRRFDDDSMSTKAKITGAYASSALAKTEAIKNGYHESIFLNRDGKVCEASGANVFGVKDGIIFTPPLSANNLNGITRRSVVELAKQELGMEVREENIDRSTLYSFEELFFTGTAAKISWIASVDRKKVGAGRQGKVVKKLQDLFAKISVNEMEKYSKWLTKVY